MAEYLIDKYKPEFKGLGYDVCNVSVSKPLIAKTGKEQFRVSATANWADKSAAIQIYSVTPEGKKIIDHGTCQVKFFDCAASELEWKRSSYLIKRSIELLEHSALKGNAHRLRRGMVYKLFSALVDYDENFQSIREVILDSEQHEATALVKFQAPPADFHRNPFWIDSFGHLSGFIMNASDGTDSKSQVFVNHGWDSMRCLKKFSPDVTYRTYVRMQPWRDSIWAGDVYIFDGEDVVAVFGGIKVSNRSFAEGLLLIFSTVPSSAPQDSRHVSSASRGFEGAELASQVCQSHEANAKRQCSYPPCSHDGNEILQEGRGSQYSRSGTYHSSLRSRTIGI